MNRLIRITMKSALSATLLGLVACNGIPGAESGGLPPGRPTASVSGFVVDDAISDARINVYAFDGGIKGELMGSATTASDGSYTLEIDGVNKRPVLVEARGGHYVELSTGRQVVLKDDEVLKAIALFEPGQPLSLMVTPLTHLAVALVEFQLGAGADVEAAITSASSEINALFGFDVFSVYPRSIADQGTANGVNDEHLYGFFLSALSSWTKRISEQNGLAHHEVYNSIGLSQILFNELASDSLLDGKASINGSGDSGDLALGIVGLDASTYRISFAQHMLAMAAGSENHTGISVEDLFPLAVQFLNSQHRVFAGVATELKGDQVDVTVEENLGSYRSGVFDYAVTLGSPDLISRVTFSIDGVELPVAVVPGEMLVPIDSRQFQDGERTLTMVARDWLGNTVANVSSTFKFDNTAPFVNVTSGLYTNQQTYILSGDLVDNGSGVSQFEIEGQAVPVAEDNSWSTELQLDAGNNSINILLRDWAGNEFAEDLVITPDRAAPVIDTSAGHGAARFLNVDDQIVAGVLVDENTADPVYIENDKIDLDGLPITRVSLEQGQTPYFSFTAHDPIIDGVSTAADALDVKVRYEKNGEAVSDWRTLTVVDGEYLVPLASETLHATWHQATPGDEHVVRIQVIDKASNVAEKLFTFKSAFVVPKFVADKVNDLNSQLFTNTTFSNRGGLHDLSFESVAYEFTNSADQAIYVQVEDVGGHEAERNYEQLVREHKVRLKTSTDWTIGTAQNAANFCDGALNEVFWNTSINPQTVFNYVGGEWLAVNRPSPMLGEVQNIDTDTPVAPDPEPWSNIEDFDAEHASFTLSVAQGDITFLYDYVVSTDTLLPEPGLIMNWSLDNNDANIRSCGERRLFQERLSYSYESEPGYPKDSLSILNEQKNFAVAGYHVMNTTTATEIVAINGWYHIPAGHSVSIIKQVHTPIFTVDDDVEVGNSGTTATYTPLFYDKSINWKVFRKISLTAIHDAGEENIFLMPIKVFSAGEEFVNYSISR